MNWLPRIAALLVLFLSCILLVRVLPWLYRNGYIFNLRSPLARVRPFSSDLQAQASTVLTSSTNPLSPSALDTPHGRPDDYTSECVYCTVHTPPSRSNPHNADLAQVSKEEQACAILDDAHAWAISQGAHAASSAHPAQTDTAPGQEAGEGPQTRSDLLPTDAARQPSPLPVLEQESKDIPFANFPQENALELEDLEQASLGDIGWRPPDTGCRTPPELAHRVRVPHHNDSSGESSYDSVPQHNHSGSAQSTPRTPRDSRPHLFDDQSPRSGSIALAFMRPLQSFSSLPSFPEILSPEQVARNRERKELKERATGAGSLPRRRSAGQPGMPWHSMPMLGAWMTQQQPGGNDNREDAHTTHSPESPQPKYRHPDPEVLESLAWRLKRLHVEQRDEQAGHVGAFNTRFVEVDVKGQA